LVRGGAEHPSSSLHDIRGAHLYRDERINLRLDSDDTEMAFPLEKPRKLGDLAVFVALVSPNESEGSCRGVQRRDADDRAHSACLPPSVVVAPTQTADRSAARAVVDRAVRRRAGPSRGPSTPRRDGAFNLLLSRVAEERADRVHELDGRRAFDRAYERFLVVRLARRQRHDRAFQQRSNTFHYIAVCH
jgi:hypothetical protein